MPSALEILDIIPSATDFYAYYWNQRPFVVRAAIPEGEMTTLISADELAGLAMEEAPQSRLVKTAGVSQDWSCAFGPFSEQTFNSAGNRDWSLLVQNVEQFHPDTAKLLRHFNFAPRWLMDDIMVSFSTPGGSVGPHLDSYHVFLVQGQGTRRWKVGRGPVNDETYIEGLDLKVLDGGFDSDEIEVGCGDVLYLPPKFAHQGTTLESALTFSVGFLGPKLSELYTGYGQYLSEREEIDQRYVGDGLKADSAGFTISSAAATCLQGHLADQLNKPDFTRWLAEFFTQCSHEDFGTYSEREKVISLTAFEQHLKDGIRLIKPEYIKFAITASPMGGFCLGVERQSFNLDERLLPVVQQLMKEEIVGGEHFTGLFDVPATLEFLLELYNHQALEFIDPD